MKRDTYIRDIWTVLEKSFDDYRTSQLERHGFSEDDETPTNISDDTSAIDVEDTRGENEGTIGHANITDSGKTKHIHLKQHFIHLCISVFYDDQEKNINLKQLHGLKL